MDTKRIADDLEAEYLAVANGIKKPAKIALEPMVRAVDALRALAPTAEQTEGVRALTADDADMVWPDDDGESMFHTIDDAVVFHTIDDAVGYMVELNWPDTAPLEVHFQIAKRIPNAKVRIFNITESGHEWELVAAPAASAGDQEVGS